MSGIFKSVSQALNFSYDIEQYPPGALSQMNGILTKLRASLGEQEQVEPSTVNFGGLTPLEVRYQCDTIRGKVREQLPPRLASAIEARYSGDRDTKRFAVRAVAQLVVNELAWAEELALALTWRHYMPKERRDKDFTLRQLADSYGTTKSRAGRMAGRLDVYIAALELEAHALLALPFALDKIIELPLQAA